MEISYWDSSISSRIARPNVLAATCWLLVAIILSFGAKSAYAAEPLECGDRTLQATSPDDPPDLTVTGNCLVPIGYKHYFRNVNILKGGKLAFHEGFAYYRTETQFWASSIIIENGGALVADGGNGMDVGFKRPYGYITNGTLTIHLYGSNEAKWNRATDKFDIQNAGAPCKTRQDDLTGPCGIPLKNDQGINVWENNGKDVLNLPGKVRDRFYQYGALYGDARCKDPDNPNSKTVVFHEGQCKADNGAGAVVPKAKLEGYFGNKVLAVSYGGTLDLAGKKGALYDDPRDNDPLFSGDSWIRLEDRRSLERDASILYLERSPRTGWKYDDEIVLTTTDYLPGHTEKLKILPAEAGERSVVFEAVESPTKKLQWPHNGVRYGGPNDSGDYQPWQEKLNRWPTRLEPRIQAQLDPDLVNNGAETRAAVALLTRSIRIVSAGDVSGADFGHRTAKDGASTDPEDPTYSYGGHMVIRQGFERVQIQGVEFKQMGQGGRLAHYPVHFHMARKTPDKTYIKDSSINESMTRWIVIHSTQGVTIARNVGYKSIGHGFYLEDGTETDNKFHSNIGILARAAILNPVHNPRSVPGILADNQGPASFKYPQLPNPAFPYRSDVEHPTIFWIANGWNDFIGNMAAGAGACGAAYWLVPSTNSDHLEVPTAAHKHGEPGEQMDWTGYAGLQKPAIDPKTKKKLPGNGGATPLKSFYKNYATSTMYSFQTTPDAPECLGFIAADTTAPSNLPTVKAVLSDSPKPLRTKNDKGEEIADNQNDHFYPHVIGGARRPTECISKGGDEYDCVGDQTHKVLPCASTAPNNADCTVTVLDHFTSSFHWAHGNASAIWLRPYWYLLTNSVITDVQNGGLTFVSGGDYTRASAIEGYWALAKSSIFIGRTNNSPYASTTGPTYMGSSEERYNVRCARLTTEVPPYCLLPDHGISMPTGGFFTNQRLTNIYDGPSYQDSNTYLDITTADCERWPTPDKPSSCIYGSTQSLLVLKRKPDKQPRTCYLPHAAIGWKQPNGFYYPPAFHSKNLFFDNVQLRHFVIAPMFSMLDKERDGTPVPRKYDFGQGGTYRTNEDAVQEQYCIDNKSIFDNWTSIDRQTELNDDDGSLTGLSNSLSGGPLKQTISINEDTFFAAPVETPECGSADGPNTLPANACKAPDPKQSPVTARTSPYDYLTTVIYHNQDDDTAAEKALWGSDCAHETCYGIPLYRQYLTGDKTGTGTREWKQWYANECGKAENLSKVQCRWPFIRMSGLDLAQRQTLTINNGVYYVDTTVSEKTQRAENFSSAASDGRTLNVFKAGKTYYMFFVYGKNSTKQTYYLYVGKNFNTNPDSDARGFKPGRMNIDTKKLAFTPLSKDQAKTAKWATAQPVGDGMLKVTIDFSTATDLSPTSGNGLCQPRKFCQPSGNSCVLKKDSPLLAANKDFAKQNADVCSWAVKDLDCPPGGCYGFSFTLVDAVDDDVFRRPKVDSFPTTSDDTQGEPKWGTKFTPYVQRSDVKPDMCIYKSVPGTDCPVP